MTNITAQQRTSTGSNACKKIREAGEVPASIYGAGKESVHITLPLKSFVPNLAKEDKHVFVIKTDKNEEKVTIQEVQRNPVNDEILHVDFCRVAE